ncbi:enoyl-CoA hydratase/isomerase family protein [Candidatus Poriferisodalis sp.]|uniref:enoyl-CoA hydratase/isomerase family protein n=1 Tax=Candidatus Poriferisodalis sp. TaxID=3101277 RepID=UPI003C6F84B4
MAERVRLVFGRDGVATITLCHPPLNIYDLEMRDGLIEAITAVRDVPDVRCVVLAAEGKHFSAGADLSEFGTADSIFDARRIRWDRDPWLPLVNLPVPTLCSLHGYALGSGLEMSLLCDLRIASADAVMGLPEVKLGMLPAAGGTQSLTAAIGPAAALPLVLSGRTVDAAEAHRLGIVCEVVPTDDLDSRTAELAGQLAGIERPVARALRRCLRAANDLPLGEGLAVERRSARLVAADSID